MRNKPSQVEAEVEFLKQRNTKTFQQNETKYQSALFSLAQKYQDSPKYADRTVEDIISWAKISIIDVKFQSDPNNNENLWSQMLEIDLIHQQASVLWKEITSATANLMNNLLKKLDFTETMNEIPSQDLQNILYEDNIKTTNQRLTKKINELTIIKDSWKLDEYELFKIANILMNDIYKLIIQPLISKLFLQYRFFLLPQFTEQELTSALQKLLHEEFKNKRQKIYTWWKKQLKLQSSQVLKEFEILFDQIDCQAKFQGSILIDLQNQDNLVLKEFIHLCNSEKLIDIINYLSHQAFDRLKDRLIENTLAMKSKQNNIIDNFLQLENLKEIFEDSVKDMCYEKQNKKEEKINKHYEERIKFDLPLILSRQFQCIDQRQFQSFIFFMIHCIPANSPLAFAEKVIPFIEYIASYSQEDNEQINWIIQSLKKSIKTNSHQELLKSFQKATLENFSSFRSYLEKCNHLRFLQQKKI